MEPNLRRLPKASPDGLVAAVLLSFLATAGFFYVNLMPALIDGLVVGLKFTESQAGTVASANVYGATFGALLAIPLVRRCDWRKLAVWILLALLVIDTGSIFVRDISALIVVRAIDGIIGGVLVGTAFAVIARTASPDRVFGMLLVVQFGLGGVGVMYLPRLVPSLGHGVVFAALIGFNLVTLAMLPFLAAYPVKEKTAQNTALGAPPWRALILALAAIFLFQAGNMALAAYMIGLGRAFGLAIDFITMTLGAASWIGAIGSILVIVAGTRLGRFWPVLVAFIPTLLGNAAFHLSASPQVFFVANVGTAVTWAFIMPYLLGICASLDKTGRMAALAGFFSHMGLATGPLLGGLLLAAPDYRLLINAAVAVLCISAAAALVPAFLLDRRSSLKPQTLAETTS